ncbi:MAG TPA: hypothetical protein V6D17_22730 [Candidatus Obscuribacterales bacterium]
MLRTCILILTLIFVGHSHSACGKQIDKGGKASNAGHAIAGWSLNQKSAYAGDNKIHFTATAIKIEHPQRNIIVLSSAPDWTIHIFNTMTKRSFSTKIDKWYGLYGKGMMITSDSYLSDVPVKLKEVAGPPVAGLATKAYAYASPKKRGLKNQILKLEYYIAKDVMVPEKISYIINRLYNAPRIDGLPLKMTCDDISGTTLELQTTSCKKNTFDSTFFELPKGFAAMKDDQSVLMSSGSIRNMRLMVETFDALGGLEKK